MTVVDASLQGGKGKSLAQLSALGMPVPPGFTVLVPVFGYYVKNRHRENPFPPGLMKKLRSSIVQLERATKKKFGSRENPLLVSVRSGAPISMPGMMETILNVGINDSNVEALAERYGARFAYDSYRRLLEMFASTVFGIDQTLFSLARAEVESTFGTARKEILTAQGLRELCVRYKQVIANSGREFPQDPVLQLMYAILGVYRSWESERAVAYRRSQNISDYMGTAVTIQSMVFGNLNERSGTGVVFSRNPNTGDGAMCGDFLEGAQGEEVVAGIARPKPIDSLKQWNAKLYSQLLAGVRRLEQFSGEIVDVEFTIEDGQLYFLQWRPAKTSVKASIAFLVTGVSEGRLAEAEAASMVSEEQLAQLLQKTFAEEQLFAQQSIQTGIAASGGAAVGRAAFSANSAREYAERGESYVLLRSDTSTRDLPMMLNAAALVTVNGGEASHAAIVARGMKIPAVVGCAGLVIRDNVAVTEDNSNIREGDWISVDGTQGMIFAGVLELCEPRLSEVEILFLRWVDAARIIMPDPRLDTALDRKGATNVNDAVNTFYLVGQMLGESRDEPGLHRQIAAYCKVLHVQLAEVFVCYLMLAVAGELRHTTAQHVHLDARQRQAWSLLKKHYSVADESATRLASQNYVRDRMHSQNADKHMMFFHLAAVVFAKNWTASGMGGKPWAAIAQAGADFLDGKMSHTIFVDLVFDLEHNTGSVFDKHEMIVCNTDLLEQQLDARRDASSIRELFQSLTRLHPGMSQEVANLWNLGRERGIW